MARIHMPSLAASRPPLLSPVGETRARSAAVRASAASPRGSVALVQRDAGADPGFFLVEIDAHHFALTHPDEVVRQDRLAAVRPEKHHADLRLGTAAVDGLHAFGVLHLLLQDPAMG